MATTDEETIEAIRQVAREFTRRELMPLERDVQRRETERGLSDEPLILPDEKKRLQEVAKNQGLVGIDMPEDWGGLGLGLLAKCVAVEEFNYSITPFRVAPETPNFHFLRGTVDDWQRENYLVPYAKGEKTSALALSEPDAGSDVGGIKTRATWDGDVWTITGNKLWISFADHASFFVTIAVTDPALGKNGGMTAFLVDRDEPGLTISPPIPLMGADRPYELRYEQVRVGPEKVLGEVGKAFVPLTNRLGVRRIEIAARCVGICQRLIDMMVDYALTRETFGLPIAERQAVQHAIADAQIEMQAARLMVYDAARRFDEGQTDLRLEASAVKVYATEMLTRTSDRAMQIYGAMGYSKELPIEFIYRSGRVLRIVEGVSEIHRTQIAKVLYKRRTS